MSWLDRAARRLLDRLPLRVHPRTTSQRQGGHRSPVLNQGVEFADHRHYIAGDDVRHIDWKAFARHGQLTIRLFEEEKDAIVYVMLDVSGSMSRGKPPKIDAARRLAAAYAYVGMRQFDRVRVIPFSEDLEGAELSVYRPHQLPELNRFLDESVPTGITSLPAAARSLAAQNRGRGLVVIISDLMAPEGWDEGFRRLGALGHEIRVLRVGCKEDLMPDFSGELELYDAETEDKVRLRVGSDLLDAYRRVVREHLESVELACKRSRGRYIALDAEMPLEKLLRTAFTLHATGRAAG